MGEVVYIHEGKSPPPAPAFIPAEFMNTPRRHQTWCFWHACGRARHNSTMALRCLYDIVMARPSERLACAAGGTLASLGHGYVLEGWQAS